jgi:divalent metal cation (Fe/Co/Zn/Cd) transporter
MRRLREILRNQYIGAIAIGFLLFQAAGDIINMGMQPIITYIQLRKSPPSVLATQSIFRWPQLIATLTDAVLHILVALLFTLWLYRNPKTKPAPAVEKRAVVSSEQPQAKS